LLARARPKLKRLHTSILLSLEPVREQCVNRPGLLAAN